jgi:hypothetical protein
MRTPRPKIMETMVTIILGHALTLRIACYEALTYDTPAAYALAGHRTCSQCRLVSLNLVIINLQHMHAHSSAFLY